MRNLIWEGNVPFEVAERILVGEMLDKIRMA